MPRARYQCTAADVPVVHRWVQAKLRTPSWPQHTQLLAPPGTSSRMTSLRPLSSNSGVPNTWRPLSGHSSRR